MKKISLLGATGSIGTSTVDVVTAYPEKFQILAFTFQNNVEKGRQLIRQLSPQFVGVGSEDVAKELAREFPTVDFDFGDRGLVTAATWSDVDVVLTAVSGSVGLLPTLQAIAKGKDIALANKESLVMGGKLVIEAAKKNKVTIFPVDSEHSAIFQCLEGQKKENVSSLLITASGGSFRELSREQLKTVTVEQALLHPNWSMGKKITIDSSTMMNKGLEVIEAHWLFNMDYDKIKVVLHRESVVHSMIEFCDGAYLAQLGASDMREAIQYALSSPVRLPIKKAKPFDLPTIGALHFDEMDFERFPMLQLAYEVGKAGETFPTVYNAANEIAAWAFIEGKISYLEIEDYVIRAVSEHLPQKVTSLDILLEVDNTTRNLVRNWIERRM